MVTKKDDLITIELPQKGYLVMAQDLFVTQWNTGQKLAILGVTDGTEVEFGNEVVKETLRRQIIDGVVAIPDIMLTYTNTIFAYVEIITANSQTTKYKIVITVEEKTKPSDYIYPEDEPTFREEMQALLDAKQDKLIAGDNITIDENNKISATGGGTSIPTDYVPTTRKVANKELKEDITGYDIINSIKDLTDFWIAVYNAMAKDTNVTNFFSLSSVLQAINKIFYNKFEVDGLLKAITTLSLETVESLPTENISTLKIYLVPKVNADGKNNYEEWINLDGTVDGWEFIGTTEVDLTNYATKEEVNTAIKTLIENIAKGDEWQLLHQYTLEEDTNTIIDFNTFDFAGKYKEIRIQLQAQCSKSSVPIYIYFNGSTSNLMNIANCTYNVNSRYDFIFNKDLYYSNSLQFTHAVRLERTQVSTNVTYTYINRGQYLEEMTELKNLRMEVQSEGTFPAGTRISILGKKA